MLNIENISFIVIHCTDSSRDFTTFEQVNYWHKSNGWKSERSGINIGYHFFLNGKGQIFEGRKFYGKEVEKGAAQYGLNDKAIGICLALA